MGGWEGSRGGKRLSRHEFLCLGPIGFMCVLRSDSASSLGSGRRAWTAAVGRDVGRWTLDVDRRVGVGGGKGEGKGKGTACCDGLNKSGRLVSFVFLSVFLSVSVLVFVFFFLLFSYLYLYLDL